MVPFQLFPTADAWIVVACPKQRLWEQLCGVLEREDLLADERFADFAGRDEHRDVLLPALKAAFGRRTTAEWLERCAAAGVPAGPVNDVAAALQDPQVAAREVIRDLDHPVLGHVRHIASPLRVGERVRDVEPAPRLGEHTDAVLRDLCGYDGATIARLHRDGVVG
jgi:crotonobetainyl-CoA:carnitine CoA-transferase CaiB-like acyl-CoA transferase